MINLYYNPACSKCRTAKDLLTDLKVEYKIRKYIKDPLTQDELLIIINKLKNPIEAIRGGNYKDSLLSVAAISQLLTSDPTLMQRPIIETDKKAIIGRSPELIYQFLNL
jgi:arsenate reductase (glutaredoxin)